MTHTPHSVGIPWTSDQPDAENSTWQQTTLTRDKRSRTWRDWNLKSQEATSPDLSLRQRSQRYWYSVAALRSVFVSANCTDALKIRKRRGEVEEPKQSSPLPMQFTFFSCLKTPETCHKVSMSVIVSTLHLELCIFFLYTHFCDLKMAHSDRNMSSSA